MLAVTTGLILSGSSPSIAAKVSLAPSADRTKTTRLENVIPIPSKKWATPAHQHPRVESTSSTSMKRLPLLRVDYNADEWQLIKD